MAIEEKIKRLLSEKISESGTDREEFWIRVDPKDIAETIGALRNNEEIKFDILTDICGVDNYPAEPRFEVVYHLLSMREKYRLRVKVSVPKDSLAVPSVVSVWPGADWMEREAFDMYGIRFADHPDLRRILMHEDFTDYPQRKDFPLRGWREDAD